MHTLKEIERLSFRFSWLFLLMIVFSVFALSYVWKGIVYLNISLILISLFSILAVYGAIVYLFNTLYKKRYKRDKDFLIMFSGFMLGFPSVFVCFLLLILAFITLDPLFLAFSFAWSFLVYPLLFIYGFLLSSFIK